MKKRAKEHKNSQRTLPETFGARSLSFGERKIASIMKTVYRSARDEFCVNKFTRFGRVGFQADRTEREVPEKIPLNPSLQKGDVEMFLPLIKGRQGGFYRTSADAPLLKSSELRARGKHVQLPGQKPQTDQGTPLPPAIRKFFSRLLRIQLPSVRIHQSKVSDKFLRAHQADAMTIGRNIFFRSGKFDVSSARGLGLLGHELTHVAQKQTNDWRNPVVSRSTEHLERSARENERFILAHTQSPSQRQGLPSTTGLMARSASTLPSTPASATPMFADASRDVSVPPDIGPEEANSVMLSESEMSRIKEEVYRDLMMRIKIESERGA